MFKFYLYNLVFLYIWSRYLFKKKISHFCFLFIIIVLFYEGFTLKSYTVKINCIINLVLNFLLFYTLSFFLYIYIIRIQNSQNNSIFEA
jgi:hypothetical protein